MGKQKIIVPLAGGEVNQAVTYYFGYTESEIKADRELSKIKASPQKIAENKAVENSVTENQNQDVIIQALTEKIERLEAENENLKRKTLQSIKWKKGVNNNPPILSVGHEIQIRLIDENGEIVLFYNYSAFNEKDVSIYQNAVNLIIGDYEYFIIDLYGKCD